MDFAKDPKDVTANNADLNNRETILGLLDEFGVVIVPNYLDSDVTASLLLEFHKILKGGPAWIEAIDYSMGVGKVLKRHDMDTSMFPETDRVFNSDLMMKLTQDYLGDEADFNFDIFCMRDVVGSKHHANDLHFDVLHTFKFFIYLTDTSKENGAFACVPGSHKITGELRVKHGDDMNYENRYLSRELPVKDGDIIPIEGPAGTLIIFDTDVFHQAGTVSSGERLVMRAHSRIPKVKKQVEEKGQGILSRVFGKR